MKKLLKIINETLTKYENILDYASFGENNIVMSNEKFRSNFNEQKKFSNNKKNIINIDNIPYWKRETFKIWNGTEIKIPMENGNDKYIGIIDFENIEKIKIESFNKTWYLKFWVKYNHNEKPHSGADSDGLIEFQREKSGEFFKEMIRFNLSINSHLQPTANVESFSNFLGTFKHVLNKEKDTNHNYVYDSYELVESDLNRINESKVYIITELYKTTFNRKDMTQPYPSPNIESNHDNFKDNEYNKYHLIGKITNPMQLIFEKNN